MGYLIAFGIGFVLGICFAMIDAADLVAFLPGWRTSPGARLERAYCSYIGKGTIDFECKEGGV